MNNTKQNIPSFDRIFIFGSACLTLTNDRSETKVVRATLRLPHSLFLPNSPSLHRPPDALGLVPVKAATRLLTSVAITLTFNMKTKIGTPSGVPFLLRMVHQTYTDIYVFSSKVYCLLSLIHHQALRQDRFQAFPRPSS